MRDLSDLLHQSEPLPGGGEVLVLDTGALIGPESAAMLGALHSRSAGGIRSHLKQLAAKGSDNFMSTFYVGYGHKSIGDMGQAIVFIEGVSMLAAKAIQDFPLYNGQEVSTRYVDFTNQPMIDPRGTQESRSVLENWRSFYLTGLEELVPALMERFPRQENEKPMVYEKAVRARAFDIMRAFLPAGTSTNLAWYGELRQFADRLPVLRNHPLDEVRAIGDAIEATLLKAFPNSFTDKRYGDTEQYQKQMGKEYAYYDALEPASFRLAKDMLDKDLFTEYQYALQRRPPKTELPWAVRDMGTLRFDFLLDFGSFRDLQRQRSVIIPMPLLTARHGFESWYLDEMPESLRRKAEALILTQVKSIDQLILSETETQYYLPMGFRVPIRLTGDLRALVYVVELRTAVTVHPTLRVPMIKVARELERVCDPWLALYYDAEPNRFDVKRGEHDIVSVG